MQGAGRAAPVGAGRAAPGNFLTIFFKNII